MKKFLIIWIMASLCCPCSRSAEDQQDIFTEEVVILANPIIEENNLDIFSNHKAVITQKQISGMNAQDLPSALRRVPGIINTRYNITGSYGGADGGSLFIRGLGISRPGAEISTMIDGIQKFAGVWTHPLMDHLNIDIAESIEISKSPDPIFTGNMAFGAVNIKSRNPSEDFRTELMLGYGTYDTLQSRLEVSDTISSLGYYLMGSRRQSRGHRENSRGEIDDLFLKLKWEINENWDIAVQDNYSDSYALDPGRINDPVPGEIPRFATDSNIFLITLQNKYRSMHGSLKLYYDLGSIDWRQWDNTEDESFFSITDYRNQGIKIMETVVLFPDNTTVFGLDYESSGGNFAERHLSGDRLVTDARFYNLSPYIISAQSFGFHGTVITPSIGIRYNNSRYFGRDTAGHVGLNASWAETKIYAKYSNTYNLPGVYAVVNYNGWNRQDEWKRLEAENLDHIEAGIIHSPSRAVSMTLIAYTSRVENALRFIPPSSDSPPRFDNTGAYRTKGFELNLELQVSDRITLYAGGNYSKSSPANIPNNPELTVSSGLAWGLARGTDLSLDYQFIGRQYTYNPRYSSIGDIQDSYSILNGRLSFSPWQGTKGITAFIAVENISNETYSHRTGYPMPGHTFVFGIEWAL